MNVIRGKIARELAAIEEQLDRVLDQSLGPAFRVAARADRFRPAVDVFHAEEAVIVRVDLAGVAAEDVRLVVDGEFLQISGRRRPGYDEPPRRHIHMEISQGAFERVLRLPGRYDPDQVTTSLDQGLLTIRLPAKVAPARQIPVEFPDRGEGTSDE